ncbi:phosphatidylethanolamine-binding protein [Dichotomocladium elegans]|nr:phosphatidylethanolamine-binding protein [Dichotomocladium elegans]
MPLLTSDMNLNIALKKAGLIPELIDEGFSPQTLLQVVYPNDKEVLLGNQLSKDETQEMPRVFFVPTDRDASYTLIMTDPDAPSASDHQFGPWRHWVAVNIPGANPELTEDDKSHHTPYVGPGPGPNTGKHRYLFLLYKQPHQLQAFQSMPHEEKAHRRQFDLKMFVAAHNLELVAANFFVIDANQ